MSGRMKAQWISYLTDVVPAEAAIGQIRETRRAFYAGAQALFKEIACLLDPGEQPTDLEVARLEEIVIELREFGERAGRNED